MQALSIINPRPVWSAHFVPARRHDPPPLAGEGRVGASRGVSAACRYAGWKTSVRSSMLCARLGVGRGGRVGERGVRHEARRDVGPGVGDLQQQRLVAPHLGHVVPLMARVVLDRIGLADPVAIDQIGRHQIVGLDGARVAHRERRVAQRLVEDRAPQIDDLHAALQQFLGLVAHQVAHPLRAGAGGVVDMHPGRRLARAAARAVLDAGDAAALQMVENEDAAGAGHLLEEAPRPRGSRPGGPRHRPRNRAPRCAARPARNPARRATARRRSAADRGSASCAARSGMCDGGSCRPGS